MAIEVVTLPVYFPESQLRTSRMALGFILAGAELGLASEAEALVEAKDELATVLTSADTHMTYCFNLTGEQDPDYAAGQIFIDDTKAACDEIAGKLTNPDLGFYDGEFWPTLLHINDIRAGIVVANAEIALHTYYKYGEKPPQEFVNLKHEATAGANRLTVSGMMKYLASL